MEEVAKAVGGGYCRLQMPLKPALGVRGASGSGHPGGRREGYLPFPSDASLVLVPGQVYGMCFPTYRPCRPIPWGHSPALPHIRWCTTPGSTIQHPSDPLQCSWYTLHPLPPSTTSARPWPWPLAPPSKCTKMHLNTAPLQSCAFPSPPHAGSRVPNKRGRCTVHGPVAARLPISVSVIFLVIFQCWRMRALLVTRSGSHHVTTFLEGVHAPRAHRVRYLNTFSRKWSTFEALVNTVPWWRLLGEELWQGVRALRKRPKWPKIIKIPPCGNGQNGGKH